MNIKSKVAGFRFGLDDFWKDTFVADIKNKPATVKMYYDRSGGEAAFKRDIKLLAENV